MRTYARGYHSVGVSFQESKRTLANTTGLPLRSKIDLFQRKQSLENSAILECLKVPESLKVREWGEVSCKWAMQDTHTNTHTFDRRKLAGQ